MHTYMAGTKSLQTIPDLYSAARVSCGEARTWSPRQSYISLSLSLCIYIYVYIYIYACISLYMYTCIYIYTYI